MDWVQPNAARALQPSIHRPAAARAGRSPALEPGRHISGPAHDNDAGNADNDLRQERLLEVSDDDLGRQSKKGTDAEYKQGLLAASANWPEHRPAQPACAGRHGHADQPGQGQELHDAQHVDIGLVDRIEQAADPGGRRLLQRIIMPGQGDEGGEQHEQDGQHGERSAEAVEPGHPRPQHRQGRAGIEDQLPGHRIEEPHLVVRIARQVPVVVARRRIQHQGSRDHRQRPALHHRQDEGKGREQDDIERQDVEIGRPEAQQCRRQDRLVGILAQAHQFHFLDQGG